MSTKLRKFFCLVFLSAIVCMNVLSNVRAASLETNIEKGLGDQIAQELEAESGVVNDPLLTAWVTRVGNQLAFVSGRRDVKYMFKILDSDDINACAVPGGHIYVTKGMMRFVNSEDELAGVLGHEIGHITAKHTNQQLKVQILGSLVLSAFKNSRMQNAIGGARLAGLFALLKFSRDNELEADELGLKSSSQLGYDGHDIMDLFKRMDEQQKDKQSRFESYFETHPPFKDRIYRLSQMPEMQDSPDNMHRWAINKWDRGLQSQAEALWKKAPSSTLEMKASWEKRLNQAGLDKQFAASPVEKVNNKDPRFDASFDSSVKLLQAKFQELDKRQQRLEKLVKTTYSNLSFASTFIQDYDVVRNREFTSALEAADDVARTASELGAVRKSADETLKELSSLKENLAKGNVPAGLVSMFRNEAPAAVSAIGTTLDSAVSSGDAAQRSAKSVDFAAHQLLSSVMMPAPTALGMTGAIDLQLNGVKRSIKDTISDVRNLSSAVEKERATALEMRIDLETSSVNARQAYSYEQLIAGYCGLSEEEVQATADRLGTFGGAALTWAKKKAGLAFEEAANEDRTAKDSKSEAVDQSPEINFEGVSILLKLISNDIEREKAATGQVGHVQAR